MGSGGWFGGRGDREHWLEMLVPPPLVVFMAGLMGWVLSLFLPSYTLALPLRAPLTILALLSSAALGLAGVVGFRRARTTVNPHRPGSASRLVTSGVFRISRNPMYLAMALLLVAFAIWMAFPWGLVGLLGFVLYMNRFQIRPEERVLTRLFGEEYMEYCSRVRRWV